MSELRTALLQCTSDVLYSAYQLWQLTCVKTSDQYVVFCSLQPLFKHHPLASVSKIEHDDAQHMVVKVSENSTLHVEGPFSLKRKGEHALGALGVKPTQAHRAPHWMLFHLPEDSAQSVLVEHFHLHNYDVRRSSPQEREQWLWVRQPELFLTLKYIEDPSIRIFQSFEEAPFVFTPWGQEVTWTQTVESEAHSALLVLDEHGGSQTLDTAEWWMASEFITVSNLPQADSILPATEPTPIPVQLRYESYTSPDVPNLWLLHVQYEEHIEALFFELPPSERSAVHMAVGSLSESQQEYYILRDDRPHRGAPLFQTKDAVGFEPLLPNLGLFIETNTRVIPTLPAQTWTQTLPLAPTHYTLLQAPSQDEYAATHSHTIRCELDAFSPLEHFVDYQIGRHTQSLRHWVQQSTCSLLFTPTEWEEEALEAPNQTVHAVLTASEPGAEPTVLTPQPPPSNIPAHLTSGKTATSRLVQLEKIIQKKARKQSVIEQSEWIELASLYEQEYGKKEDVYWLHEAIKTLDQVLYLDRTAEHAVQLESEILAHILSIPVGSEFSVHMQLLEEHILSESPLRMRFAFRARARLLLQTNSTSEVYRVLRRFFYKDLARVEELLMIRECMIYSVGVAQKLDDTELLERSRHHYRQSLSDPHRLQRELPEMLINY